MMIYLLMIMMSGRVLSLAIIFSFLPWEWIALLICSLGIEQKLANRQIDKKGRNVTMYAHKCTNLWKLSNVQIFESSQMYKSLKANKCTNRWKLSNVQVFESSQMYKSLKAYKCTNLWKLTYVLQFSVWQRLWTWWSAGAARRRSSPHPGLTTLFPSVLFSFCSSVLLSFCPSVLLSCCPSVLLSFCPSVLLSFCPFVL